MLDKRVRQLASLLVHYSVKVKPKENVLIILYGLEGYPLLKEIYRECVKVGAHCTYEIRDAEMTRLFFENANENQIRKEPPQYRLDQAEHVHAMFQILADRNSSELAHIDQAKMIVQRKTNKRISDILHSKRWVLFEYPTVTGANNAKMSVDAWEDFVYKACLIDWDKISEEQEALKNILEQTSEIRIVAKETDLSLNVAQQNWIKCHGVHNMPDGEVFSSPHKYKVKGTILFNTPTQYMGQDFQWIKLTFEEGKVVDFDSDNQQSLGKILSTDEGSSYLGEFAFGTNRFIQEPVKSILIDEKIGGSNHMALGKCYDDAPNGNVSSIHWDLIIRHAEAQGRVYLDGEMVQENGIWISPELVKFNR